MSDLLGDAQPVSLPSREEQLEVVLLSHERYFDIERGISISGGLCPAMAQFHNRSEKYMLVKAAKIYAMEQHEYAYFLLADTLEEQVLKEAIEAARVDGLGRIRPHGEHMCSYVSLSVIADQITPEAKRLLKRYRFRKSFRLSLHGWMEFRIAAFIRCSGEFLANAPGREVRERLEQNFKPQKPPKKRGEKS